MFTDKVFDSMLNKRAEGFSLIELAIALVIIGLIATPLVAIYNIYIAQLKINQTRGYMADIRDSVNLYIQANGRYPRPAPLNAVEGDVEFGSEGPIIPELCTSGMWFTSGGTCMAAAVPSNVLIGAVPFDVLALDVKHAHDFWGNKLLYVVSQPRTDALTYNSAIGGITVQVLDPSGAPITQATNYDMVMVSFGETAKGAYSNSATLISPCVGPFPEREDENCDFDNVFLLQVDPTDVNNSSVSHVTGATFYDDFTSYQREFPTDNWFLSEDDGTFAVSRASRIGIGTTDPDVHLHVIGDIKSDAVWSDEMCNFSLGSCFDPVIIAGDVAAMDCTQNTTPEAEPVLGIRHEQVECASVVTGGVAADGTAYTFSSAFNYTGCPPGQLMTGINAGNVQCAVP